MSEEIPLTIFNHEQFLAELEGYGLSALTIEDKVWEALKSSSWDKFITHLTDKSEKHESIKKSLSDLNNLFIKNIKEHKGEKHWGQNLKYLSGFIASIPLSNIGSNGSLGWGNLIGIASMVSYRALDMYVEFAHSKSLYYQRQYEKMNEALGHARDNKIIKLHRNLSINYNNANKAPYQNSPEQKLVMNADILSVMQAFVVAVNRIQTKQPNKKLDYTILTAHYMHILRAALTTLGYTNDIELGLLKLDQSKIFELSKKLEENIESTLFGNRNFVIDGYLWDSSKVLSVKAFKDIILNCCIKPPRKNYYSFDNPIEIALNADSFEILRSYSNGDGSPIKKHTSDLNLKLHKKLSEIFPAIRNSIKNEKLIRAQYWQTHILLFASSVLYGAGLSFMQQGVYYTIISGIASFIAAQIISEYWQNIQEKYSIFYGSKLQLENTLRYDFQQSMSDLNDSLHTPSKRCNQYNGMLKKINYVVARTWAKASLDNIAHIEAMQPRDIGSTSIRMYLTMCNIYKVYYNKNLSWNIDLLDEISNKWVDVFGRISTQSSHYCLLTCGKKQEAILKSIPLIQDFYKEADKIINSRLILESNSNSIKNHYINILEKRESPPFIFSLSESDEEKSLNYEDINVGTNTISDDDISLALSISDSSESNYKRISFISSRSLTSSLASLDANSKPTISHNISQDSYFLSPTNALNLENLNNESKSSPHFNR